MNRFLLFVIFISVKTFAHLEPAAEIERLSSALQKSHEDVSLYIERGRHYLEKRRYQKAARDFERAINLQPDVSVGYYYYAEALTHLQKNDKAITQARTFLTKIDEKNLEAKSRGHLLLGNLFFEKGQCRKAIFEYQSALEKTFSPTISSFLRIAECYSKISEDNANEIDSAFSVIDEGISRFGSIVTIHEKAIEIAEKHRRWNKAIQHIDMLMEQKARLASLHYRKANLLLNAGNSDAAVEEIKKSKRSFQKYSERQKNTRFGKALEKKIGMLYQKIVS